MINITNLVAKKSEKSYKFSDLNLNFEQKKVSTNSRSADVVNGNDVVIDTDIEAVKNSIKNILTQKRHLSPEKSVYLYKFIGQPINQMNAESIGEEIDRVISIYEPRIKIEKITVRYNIIQMTYFIDLRIKFQNFSETSTELNAYFNSNGNFDFINR